jgi:hypothetical protein
MEDIILFGVLSGIVAGCFGILLRMTIASRRRDEIVCLLLSAVAAVVFLVSAALGARAWMAGTPLSLAIAVVIALVHTFFHRRRLQDLSASAPEVSKCGLARFDWLDKDGDGDITWGDITLRLAERDLTAGDRRMLEMLRMDLQDIGHPTDVDVYVGTTGGPAIPYVHFGINRRDLETYPARAQAELDRELGLA